MKLQCTWLVRGLLICGLPLAGISTGCSSVSSEPQFSDMVAPPPAVAGTPVANPPTAADLPGSADVAHFHVGDIITVTFTGPPEPIAAHEEAVKEDGTITLDYIGKVQAAGKTAGELQNEIHDQYVPKYYTRLTVTVSTGERVYYVNGEVKGPGPILYRADTTVSKAITSAGGFDDFANHANVVLIRANGGKQIKVNVDKVLRGKAEDPPVYPGDQIDVKRRLW